MKGSNLYKTHLTLRQLFYFYENSCVWSSGLKALQELLETPELKLKKPLDTRWLSHDNACQTLKKPLSAVIASLEREAEERGEALAVGLSRVVQRHNFIATLYMMCDALPKVSRLSKIFQLSTIDMSELHKHVKTTIESLNTLSSNPESGDNFRKLDTDLESTLAPYNIHHSPEATSNFLNKIQKPFHRLSLTTSRNVCQTQIFCKKRPFKKTRLFETLSRSTRKAAGCQVRLVLFSLNRSFS